MRQRFSQLSQEIEPVVEKAMEV